MPDPVKVRSLFSRIAARYDFANRLLSGGIDIYWRKRLVSLVRKQSPATLLDLATGSGDLAFALNKKLPHTKIFGLDFCQPMLDQAIARQKKFAPRHNSITFQQADATQPLPFIPADAITISFGLRNLPDRPAALANFHRSLNPGGHLYVLEFSQPARLFRPFYYFYLQKILPRLAALVTRDRAAYEYLSSSIDQFPPHTGISTEILNAGFSSVTVTRMTLGIVALHHAVK